MTTTDPDLTRCTPEDLLQRALRTATGCNPPRLKEGLGRLERDQLIDVLELTVRRLAEPGRVGQLDDLAGDLAEAMFDAAHEHCDDDGCIGGGMSWWLTYTGDVLMPIIRRYAAPDAVGFQ